MLNEKVLAKRERSRVAMKKMIDRRNEAGLKRVTFWATPEVQDLLFMYQDSFPTRDDLLNAIIRSLASDSI